MRKFYPLLAAALLSPGLALADTTTWTITIPPITVQQSTSGTATPPVPPVVVPPVAVTPPPVVTPTPVVTPPTPPPAGVTTDAANKTITLPTGMEPADALGALQAGWTMVVPPGTFTKTFTTNGIDNVSIRCTVATKCIMNGQGGAGGGHRMVWGKACIHSYNASLTIDGFRFINCGSPQSGNNYSNEAAVYLDLDDGQAHALTVSHSAFDNNANGLFAAGGSGVVVVDQDVFGFQAPNGMNGVTNGTANGPAHDMYLSASSVEVKGSYFYGSAAHNVKTRAQKTNIHDNPVMTMDGGRVVDLSDGGALTFANNGVWSRDDTTFPKRTIQSGVKGGVFGNSNLLGVGTEDVNAGVPSGSLTNNVFNIVRQNSTFWVNAGSLTSSGNKVNLFGGGGIQVQGSLTGDISGASAIPGAAPHAPAPPAPPSWFVAQ